MADVTDALAPSFALVRCGIMADIDPHDEPCRSSHACWALPGAVVTLVLVIAVFFGQFGGEERRAEVATVAAAHARGG